MDRIGSLGEPLAVVDRTSDDQRLVRSHRRDIAERAEFHGTAAFQSRSDAFGDFPRRPSGGRVADQDGHGGAFRQWVTAPGAVSSVRSGVRGTRESSVSSCGQVGTVDSCATDRSERVLAGSRNGRIPETAVSRNGRARSSDRQRGDRDDSTPPHRRRSGRIESVPAGRGWAAREAERRRLPLSLVTIVSVRNTFGVPIGMPAGFFEQEESEGRDMLLDAAEYARPRAPDGDLDIETHLCTGSPSLELVDRSKSASMVVVGAGDNRFGWERFGSVSRAVVTHTHAPAVVVRKLPHVDVNDISGPVVVGVDGSEHSVRAVSAAFEEASLRGTDVVAVHAWSDLDVRGPFRFRIDWDSVENKERALLSESLAGHGEAFPDVRVYPVVVLDQPPTILRRTLPMRSCSFSAVAVEAGFRA